MWLMITRTYGVKWQRMPVAITSRRITNMNLSLKIYAIANYSFYKIFCNFFIFFFSFPLCVNKIKELFDNTVLHFWLSIRHRTVHIRSSSLNLIEISNNIFIYL